jgi:hypothetical protein
VARDYCLYCLGRKITLEDAARVLEIIGRRDMVAVPRRCHPPQDINGRPASRVKDGILLELILLASLLHPFLLSCLLRLPAWAVHCREDERMYR